MFAHKRVYSRSFLPFAFIILMELISVLISGLNGWIIYENCHCCG